MADRDKPTRRVKRSLSDDQIKSVRAGGRRSFLQLLGLTLAGATGLAVMGRSTKVRAADSDDNDAKTHHDFPKTESNDGDVSKLADIKPEHVDNDSSDGFGDDDQSHLRDVKGSQDSD